MQQGTSNQGEEWDTDTEYKNTIEGIKLTFTVERGNGLIESKYKRGNAP